MTDYSNPQVMKEVVKEAKDAGIFDKKLNKKNQYHIFNIKVSAEDALILDMIRDNKSYGYKLKQVNFQLGLSSKYNPKKTTINFIKRIWFNLNRYKYEIKCLIETKSVAERAWNNVLGKPLKLIFESNDGYIKIINIKNGRFRIKDI